MPDVTLIMSRQPEQIYDSSKRSGRWGNMTVVKGSKVLSGEFSGEDNFAIPLGSRFINVETEAGAGLEVIAQLDFLERYMTDDTMHDSVEDKKFYVHVPARAAAPYQLKKETSKKGREQLRVLGHGVQNGNKVQAGILIHEAMHVNFLLGCIGPRVKNFRHTRWQIKPARDAMKKIFKAMEPRKTAWLLVMDGW